MKGQAKKKRSKSSKSHSQSRSENFEEVADNGPVFEIKTSQLMGRYMISKRILKPGELILKETPLVVGPCSACKVQCLGCYRILEDTLTYINCKGCGWPLCSSLCPGIGKNLGHSSIECATLKSSNSSRSFDLNNFDTIRPHFSAIVPLRCLLLKQLDSKSYEKLMQMETHNRIRINIPELWRNNQIFIVDRIRDDWGLKCFPPEDIHSVCGILEVNSFEIGQQGINIRGVYPTAFLMSHDCVPNTNHTDAEDFELTVRASTRILPEKPITLSYAYTLQSTLKRREHLLENKFFECHCRRCCDPKELGAYSAALLCPKCTTGLVLSTDPLEVSSEWRCTSTRGCPGYRLSAHSMDLLLDRVGHEADAIDSQDVEGLEAFLERYRNVLHPAHYLCLGVKIALTQLYGKIGGFLMAEMNEETLQRKRALCEEVLEVFDVIEPGYTRLRGVTLYEMHAPMMILLTRQFENRACSRSEIRTKLRGVVRCLEEASIILDFEPKGSAEGIMGMAAKEALAQIRNWEAILGKI